MYKDKEARKKEKSAKKFEKVRKFIQKGIDEVVSKKEKYVKNPKTDFTRNRDLSMSDTISFVIYNNGGAIDTSIRNIFKDKKEKLPRDSALVQQRNKINTNLYKDLFSVITNNLYTDLNKVSTYLGYLIYGLDGSDINISYDENQPTHIKNQQKKNNGDYYKGYNQIHANVVYDLLNKMYVDVLFQPKPTYNERKATLEILSNLKSNVNSVDKSIFIGDGGYYSWNMIAHFDKMKKNYLFKLKHNTRLKHLLPDGDNVEANITIELAPASKKTKDPNYKVNTKFASEWDFEDEVITIDVRVIKIKLSSGKYEYLITNVFDKNLNIKNFKELYNLRWGVETSFRTLKYDIGIIYTSSRKQDFIEQEFYGKVLLYNVCSSLIETMQPKSKDRKLNNRMAIYVIMEVLLDKEDIERAVEWIIKRTIKIQPKRSFKRTENYRKRFSYFMYRKLW